MGCTTLQSLLTFEKLSYSETGFIGKVPACWIVEGENRVSYTALIRIVECCREYHWQKDVKPNLISSIDSTVKKFEGEFVKPLPLEKDICVLYNILEVRNRGYSIQFRILDALTNEIYAMLSLVCVFYDLHTGEVVSPPVEVLDNLRKFTQKPI